MADNLTAPAAGASLATDEIGSVHYPRSKVGFGEDGSYADVSSSNPLPVDIGATVGISGSVAVTGTFWQATQPVSATALPLPSGAATSALQTTLNTSVGTLLTEATFATRHPTTGPKAASGSVPIVIANDQDPVLDHANAKKASVTTTSSTAITPPAGARYLRVTATADMFIRTDGSAAADADGSILLKAGVTESIPCIGGTAVTAIVATGTGTLYATPSKSRT